MENTFAAIIPAAGLSSRMGAFKPLLEIEGAPMIVLTAQNAFDGGVGSLCVVTGRDAQKIEAVLPRVKLNGQSSMKPRLISIHNSRYAESDMLSSIKLGLRAILEQAESGAFLTPQAVFIIPGDMPGVSSCTFAFMLEAWETGGKPEILVPTYDGRKGHPLLISHACFDAVLNFKEEGGLRKALSGFEWQKISVDDRGILLDADTPEDFKILKEYLEVAHAEEH